VAEGTAGKGAKDAKDASFFVISPIQRKMPEVTDPQRLALESWEMTCASTIARLCDDP